MWFSLGMGICQHLCQIRGIMCGRVHAAFVPTVGSNNSESASWSPQMLIWTQYLKADSGISCATTLWPKMLAVSKARPSSPAQLSLLKQAWYFINSVSWGTVINHASSQHGGCWSISSSLQRLNMTNKHHKWWSQWAACWNWGILSLPHQDESQAGFPGSNSVQHFSICSRLSIKCFPWQSKKDRFKSSHKNIMFLLP